MLLASQTLLACPGHGELQQQRAADARRLLRSWPAQARSKAAFEGLVACCVAEGIARRARCLWQSAIVAYKGWRCLSKGLGKPLKPRGAFRRRAAADRGDNKEVLLLQSEV